MKKIFIIIFSLITFSLQAQNGKERANEALKSWIGSKENDLVLQLGSPTSTASDGAGGKIVRYSETTSAVIGTPIGGGAVYGTTYEETYFYEFYINSSGIVYSHKTNYKRFSKKLTEKIQKKEKTTPPTQNTPATKSKTDRLRELKTMFDEKLITKEEYESGKKKILDEKQ